jgi:transglutaminase-like putative cysteine protease
MKRTAFSHLVVNAQAEAELVLSIAASEGQVLSEELSLVQGGSALHAREVVDDRGTRLHVVRVDAGRVEIDYRVEVEGRQDPIAVGALDAIQYLRPSRYCESDTLFPTAKSEFQGLSGLELVAAVGSWVGSHLSYVPGSSAPTDGAVQTYLDRRGVCRDYAHLVVALLRARDVPARLVSVYAPGLWPTSTPSPKRWSTGSGTRSTRRPSHRGRPWSGSRRAGMRPTRLSCRRRAGGSTCSNSRSAPRPTCCRATTSETSCRSASGSRAGPGSACTAAPARPV